MGEHREVRHERLFVKVPGSDTLRKRAAGRMKHLLATGWREVERSVAPSGEYIQVRVERTGHIPLNLRLKPPPPPPARTGRGGFGTGGGYRGPGGPGGFRGGGPGGPGGGYRGGPGGPGGFRGGPGGSGRPGAPGAQGAPTGGAPRP